MSELLQGCKDRRAEAAAGSLGDWLHNALYRSGSCESCQAKTALAKCLCDAQPYIAAVVTI